MLSTCKRIGLLSVIAVFPLMYVLPSQAQTLTGAFVFSSDSTGNGSLSSEKWNTQGNDVLYNLWLKQGAAWLNGPADADASINLALTPGSHTYTLFGEQGGNNSFTFDGLNLFFDGDNAHPRLSAFGPIQTTATTSPFFADNGMTLTLDGNLVPGADVLSFEDGGQRVTLTNFSWAVPDVNNLDAVSAAARIPSGQDDYIGTFTLSVQAVPEGSSSLLLFASFASMLLGRLYALRRHARGDVSR